MPSTPASARTSSSFPPPPSRKYHLFSAQDNGFVRTSSSNLQSDHSRPTSPTTSSARKQHSRSPPPQLRPQSPRTSLRSPPPTATSKFILPGKRGKVARLILVAVILFPPVAFFLLAMLPLLLAVSVVFTYSIAWLLYWSRAGPFSFSKLPLDPRRVWKLNKVVFSVILGDLDLIPVGLALVRFRFFTMRGSNDFITDVHYNPRRPNNKMDIYIPEGAVRSSDLKAHQGDMDSDDNAALKPVVVFIYGGAWSAGSRWTYTLIGARLRSMGYVVFLPDYSIHPQGFIREMEQDVKMAIQWTHNNCRSYGGDPQKIFLMGHSAGAQLCALTVLNDSIRRIPTSLLGSSPAAITTSPILTSLLTERKDDRHSGVLPRIRGMILCSGVYDIGEHYKHESMRGVEEISAMARVMGSSELTFRQHSPTIILQELLQVSTGIDPKYPTESQTRHQHLLRHLKSLLPIETIVIHGDRDLTVPWKSSSEFYMELKTLQLGAGARLRMMAGMGHAEPVVALMPNLSNNPFKKLLLSEISQFIDGNRTSQ
ncbi:Alpha/Beta hydrolase protein [Linnemannia elongata]|nr:Alpha/Beta hydrolase protein [Linnemannia elongata]